jgi:hypothetical protein
MPQHVPSFTLKSIAILIVIAIADHIPSGSFAYVPPHETPAQYASIFIESLAYSLHGVSHGEVRLTAALTLGLGFKAVMSREAPESQDWRIACDNVLLSLQVPGGEDCHHVGDLASSSSSSSQRICRSPIPAQCSSTPSFHNGQTISSSCSFHSSTTHLRHWSFWLENPPPLKSQASISLHLNCNSSLGSFSTSSLPLLHALAPLPPQPPFASPSFPPVSHATLSKSPPAARELPSHQHAHPLFPKAFDFLKSFDASTADGRYELQGSDLFAIVSRYSPVAPDEKQWESHAVYGDIQVMLLPLLLLLP